MGILLHKKGDKKKRDNYRPICLVSLAYKVLTILIANRIQPIMNLLTDPTQAAYKTKNSCADILYIYGKITKNNRCAGKNARKNKDATFLDLSKAFDRTNRLKMYNVLLESGLPIKLTRTIKRTHERTTLNVREKNRIGTKKETNVGVFQGSPLSALLFVIYITSMMTDYRARNKNLEAHNVFIAQQQRRPHGQT